MKVALEREIKEFDKQIKDARRSATLASTLEDKLLAQKQIKSIEKIRNQKENHCLMLKMKSINNVMS